MAQGTHRTRATAAGGDARRGFSQRSDALSFGVMLRLGIASLISAIALGCASDDLTAGCKSEQWKCGSACIPVTERCEQACAPGRSMCQKTGDCRTLVECATCESGEVDCAGGCRAPDDAFFQDNDAHCGSCGNACEGGTSCKGTACACAGDATLCDAGCVNIKTSEAHCGSCGANCGVGWTCQNGTCEQCPAGQQGCNGKCVDPAPWATDPKNCGACGHDCDGGKCSGGKCEPVELGSYTLVTNDYPLGIAVGAHGAYVRTTASLQLVGGSAPAVVSLSPPVASPAVALSSGYVGFLQAGTLPGQPGPGLVWTADDGKLSGPFYQDSPGCVENGADAIAVCAQGVSSHAAQFLWLGHTDSNTSFIRVSLAQSNGNGSELGKLTNPAVIAGFGANKAIVRADHLGQPALCRVVLGSTDCYVLDPGQVPTTMALDNTHVYWAAFYAKVAGSCPTSGGVYRIPLSLSSSDTVEVVSQLDCEHAPFVSVDGDPAGFAYYGGGQSSKEIRRRKRDLSRPEETVVQFSSTGTIHPIAVHGSNPTRVYYVDGDKVFYVVP